MTDKSFWTYEYEGEVRDLECETMAEADKTADAWYEQHITDMHDDLRNGDMFDDEIVLVRFHYDAEGERVEDERVRGIVEYEHYHGDHREHSYP
jgi:hypothetical protein